MLRKLIRQTSNPSWPREIKEGFLSEVVPELRIA